MAQPTKKDELLALCKHATGQILAELQDDKGAVGPDTLSEAQKGLVSLPSEVRVHVSQLASEAQAFLQRSEGLENGQQPTGPPDNQPDIVEGIDGEIKKTYTRFYDFVYQDLPYCWRQLYTDLCILKTAILVTVGSGHRIQGTGNQEEDNDSGHRGDDDFITSLVEVLDKALILAGGAGLNRGRHLVEEMIRLLEEAHDDVDFPSQHNEDAGGRPQKRQRINESDSETEAGATWARARSFNTSRIFNPEPRRPLEKRNHMSPAELQIYMDGKAKGPHGPYPIIIRGLIDDWPARTDRPWNKPAYLLSQTFGGRRLIPVEVGRSYVDQGWGQELISFRELLRRIEETSSPPASASSSREKESQIPKETDEDGHGTDEDKHARNPPVTYLAQHELFTQLPSLRNDILTPDHCYTNPPPHPSDPSLDKPPLDLPLVNAWLGPAGTITPLHTDGYHNLLAQVVGSKYVRLYSPADSEALCPRIDDPDGQVGDVPMHNTSIFDVGVVEGWDALPEGEDAKEEIELEEFRGLEYWDCVLEEGEVLYIPIGWWHYVRSLSVSFSVSFWWNGEGGGILK